MDGTPVESKLLVSMYYAGWRFLHSC